jgi:hypothetical protein
MTHEDFFIDSVMPAVRFENMIPKYLSTEVATGTAWTYLSNEKQAKYYVTKRN